jgi:hypothetical protein
MTETELNASISVTPDIEKKDYEERLGRVQLIDNRVYVEVDGGISVGFDRYVLTELIRREEKISPRNTIAPITVGS